MDTNQLYREKILDHYRDPHNKREAPDADAHGEAANPSCGDDLTFHITIEDDAVADVAFTGSGCALSVATASLLTDELVGKPVTALKNLSAEELFGLLGLDQDTVSPMRVKCVLLSKDALETAADNYED